MQLINTTKVKNEKKVFLDVILCIGYSVCFMECRGCNQNSKKEEVVETSEAN